MKPPSGTAHTLATTETPAAPAKKSGWQSGLNRQDLDALRQGLTVVKATKPQIQPSKPSENRAKPVAGTSDRPREIDVSPVEFARLAALLAQQYGRKTPPQRYFRAADELIRLADHYLNSDQSQALSKRVTTLEIEHNDGYVAISTGLQALPKKTNQKGNQTLFGKITTKEGLIKALKRIFKNEYQDKIEQRVFRIGGEDINTDAIHQTTIDLILKDQRRANKERGKRSSVSPKAK